MRKIMQYKIVDVATGFVLATLSNEETANKIAEARTAKGAPAKVEPTDDQPE